MCVIMQIFGDKRPSEDMVDKAWVRNPHGGGVAWREADEVVWRKGLTKDEMQEFCATLPTPFVAHFRIASASGGGTTPLLCHPFEVKVDTPNTVEGRTKGYVLFHNGDWKDWKQSMFDTILKTGLRLPDGKCSDTRAMAWLCAVYGLPFMDIIGAKGCALGPNDMEIWGGEGHNAGWKEVNGVWCSNDFFTHLTSYGICKHGTCKVTIGLDSEGLCHEHRKKKVTPLPVTTKPTEVGTTNSLSNHSPRIPGFGGSSVPDPFSMEVGTVVQRTYAMGVGEWLFIHKRGAMSKKQLKKLRGLLQNGCKHRMIDPIDPTRLYPLHVH